MNLQSCWPRDHFAGLTCLLLRLSSLDLGDYFLHPGPRSMAGVTHLGPCAGSSSRMGAWLPLGHDALGSSMVCGAVGTLVAWVPPRLLPVCVAVRSKHSCYFPATFSVKLSYPHTRTCTCTCACTCAYSHSRKQVLTKNYDWLRRLFLMCVHVIIVPSLPVSDVRLLHLLSCFGAAVLASTPPALTYLSSYFSLPVPMSIPVPKKYPLHTNYLVC